jgi:DNA-binding transcriptional MerR regulator
MSDQKEATTNEETPNTSIQEASKKLSVPENTLRKYLAYFDLAIEKVGRKNYLSELTVNYLTEIIHLKSNGWSLKQIKEFREKAEIKINTQEEQAPEAEGTPQQEQYLSEVKTEDNNEHQSVGQEVQNEVVDIDKSQQESKGEPKETPSSEVLSEAEPEHNQPRHVSESTESEENIGNQVEASDASNDENEDVPLSNYNEERKRVVAKTPFTKDYVNKEIATQAKRTSRLYRFLSSRNSPRDSAEIKADLDRRVEFLNGLRYIRDNWLERSHSKDHSHRSNNNKDLASVN